MRPEDLVGAPEFKQVQTEVAELIKDRLLVGHAIHHDLKVSKIEKKTQSYQFKTVGSFPGSPEEINQRHV